MNTQVRIGNPERRQAAGLWSFRGLSIVMAVAVMAGMVLGGCGDFLGFGKDEKCWENLRISYGEEMRPVAEAFCKDHGYDRATTISSNYGYIDVICCEK